MRYQFMYKKWWKVIGMILLLYVFIAGFLVPLRPGILEVSQSKLVAGQPYNVDITTYNAHLNVPTKQLSAYIKIDSAHVTKVPYVSVSGRNAVNIKGVLPSDVPTQDGFASTTLILLDEEEGYLIYPPGFFITPADDTSVNITQTSTATWSNQIQVYNGDWKFQFPFVGILYETVRNTFFHVAIWMAMFILLVVSLIYSIRYLRGADLMHDAIAASFTHVAVGLGMLGMITGSVWAKATWGTYWTDDVKLNMSAVAMMIYLAYTILRASMEDGDKRAKVSAAYNVFAFVAMIPLIFIIPRMTETDSLHPGNGGNPALGGEDLDSTLRLIFYPAIIGYTLLGVWLSSLLFRLRRLEILKINKELKA